MVFDILDRKEWFLDQKGIVLRSAKKSTFPRRLVHGFCPKFKIFLTSVFKLIMFEKIVFWYSG